MKFAVVEYSSKTGQVWKHTDARPNYLADPTREIDPTSFGCYVSALAGEHIPLTALINGPVNPTTRLQKTYNRVVKKSTGHWPASYSIQYLQQFDTLMVVHQLSNAHEIVALLERVAALSPRPFIIGVPTQPFGILKQALEADPAAAHNFKAYMDLCDIMLTVTQEVKSWYAAKTTTPVVYMPQPYPATYASQFNQPLDKKADIIFVAGVSQRDNIRQGHKVARRLQQEFPTYVIFVPKVADLEYDDSALKGTRYTIVAFEEWREHLVSIARVKIVINTDYTFTRGRVQTDCAAVGTLSLGANSDGQRDLFPDLAATPSTSVEELVALARPVLTDPTYYRRLATLANEKLKKYDYHESADRLRLLVRTHQQK